MKLPDARYTLWGAAALVLLGLPTLAGFTELAWELCELAGWAAALACIALCACPVRPRDATPPALLSPGRHRLIGWWALVAAVLHAVGAVVVEPTALAYLEPSAPPYQWAGIAGLALLLLLAVSSPLGLRRRLWRSHRGFQAVHVVAACALATLLAAHVIGTSRYTSGDGRRLLYIAVSLGALSMLLRARQRAPGIPPAPGLLRRQAFGRHSQLVVATICVSAALVAWLHAGRAVAWLREPLLQRTQALPLAFPHGKHGAVRCVACHHNYIDKRGRDNCISCHKSARADLLLGAEARFHGFCLQCHRHPDPAWQQHGPVSGCAACHRREGEPNAARRAGP